MIIPLSGTLVKGSLDKALCALETDHEFLPAGEVFSEELSEQWVTFKRGAGYYPARNRPHPYDVNLYAVAQPWLALSLMGFL